MWDGSIQYMWLRLLDVCSGHTLLVLDVKLVNLHPGCTEVDPSTISINILPDITHYALSATPEICDRLYQVFRPMSATSPDGQKEEADMHPFIIGRKILIHPAETPKRRSWGVT